MYPSYQSERGRGQSMWKVLPLSTSHTWNCVCVCVCLDWRGRTESMENMDVCILLVWLTSFEALFLLHYLGLLRMACTVNSTSWLCDGWQHFVAYSWTSMSFKVPFLHSSSRTTYILNSNVVQSQPLCVCFSLRVVDIMRTVTVDPTLKRSPIHTVLKL